MPTFIMHTQYPRDTASILESQEESERLALEKVRSESPQMEWVSVQVIGPRDYLEIFRAPDMDTALRIAKLIHTLTSAHTEVWTASILMKSIDAIGPSGED